MQEPLKSQLKALSIKPSNFPPQEASKLAGIEELLPRIAKVEDRFFTNLWFSGQIAANIVIDDRAVRISSKSFRDAFSLAQAVEMDESVAATSTAPSFEVWARTQTNASVITAIDYTM